MYIAIALIFIMLCIITDGEKMHPLVDLQQCSGIYCSTPQNVLALGVAGLIPSYGTDLSIGRMVGMEMTAATIIKYQGINSRLPVFGHILILH